MIISDLLRDVILKQIGLTAQQILKLWDNAEIKQWILEGQWEARAKKLNNSVVLMTGKGNVIISAHRTSLMGDPEKWGDIEEYFLGTITSYGQSPILTKTEKVEAYGHFRTGPDDNYEEEDLIWVDALPRNESVMQRNVNPGSIALDLDLNANPGAFTEGVDYDWGTFEVNSEKCTVQSKGKILNVYLGKDTKDELLIIREKLNLSEKAEYQIAITWENKGAKLYLNGKPVA